jgi:hypothetical protein
MGSVPPANDRTSGVQVRSARSIFSNALNFRCSAIAALGAGLVCRAAW